MCNILKMENVFMMTEKGEKIVMTWVEIITLLLCDGDGDAWCVMINVKGSRLKLRYAEKGYENLRKCVARLSACLTLQSFLC